MSGSEHYHRSGHRGATGPAVHALDVAVEVLMTLLLVFAPLAYGTVEPWSEQVVIGLSGVMVLVLLYKHVRFPDSRWVWTWAYLPAGLFLAWTALQLVPLPVGIVKLISPQAVELRSYLLGEGVTGDTTLSLYPGATRHDLRILLAMVGVFIVTINVYRTPEAIRRLLITIVAIGGIIALLALAQDFSGTSQILWSGPMGRGDVASAGPFVHYTHFGQYMNLTIGAAIALILVALYTAFRKSGFSLREIRSGQAHPQMRLVWLLTLFILAAAVAVFLSGSRSAALGLAAAFSFTMMALSRNRRLPGRAWALIPLVMAIFLAGTFVGLNLIFEKLRIQAASDQYVQRWQILKDLTVLFKQFPIAGTGLGTHEFVFPMVDRSTVIERATHAENEYAQVLAEAGVVGLALVLWFLGIVGYNFRRAAQGKGRSIQLASLGLAFGLVAILFNSFLDFGQHLPANASLTAIFCALMVNLARLDKPRDKEQSPVAPKTRGLAPVPALAMVFVAMIWGWSLLGVDQARRAQAAWTDTQAIVANIVRGGDVGFNGDYAELIQGAAQAASADPTNVYYGLRLAGYRWQAISRVRDPETRDVVLVPQSIEHVRRIVDDLRQLRHLAPTYGPVYLMAGKLEQVVLKDEQRAADSLLRAQKLMQSNSEACLLAARVEARRQNWSSAVTKLERYLRLAGSFNEVAVMLVKESGRADLAINLARNDYGRLLVLADTIGEDPTKAVVANGLREQAHTALRAQCEQPDVPAEMLVSLARESYRRKELNQAADCYKRALGLDYGQVDWRMELARILAEANRIPEAMHEVRICLRLRGEDPVAKKFLGELSLRPGATFDE